MRSTSASARADSSGIRGLVLYYLGSPAFALLDLLFHMPVRVALPDGRARAVYYAVGLGLGVVCHRFPRAAPWIGMGESAANLLILVLAVLLPLWTAPEALLAGGGVPGREMLLWRVANLAVGGSVFLWSFYGYQAEVASRGR